MGFVEDHSEGLMNSDIVVSPIYTEVKKKEILDIFVYLWSKYEKGKRRSHFSVSRATKMVFLVDWFYSRFNEDNWRQATAIEWYYHQYGPYVNLTQVVKEKFKIASDLQRNLFSLRRDIETDGFVNLNENIKRMCKQVISKTQSLSYLGFINYVYRTPAVKLSEKFTIIQIPVIAKRMYENQQSQRRMWDTFTSR